MNTTYPDQLMLPGQAAAPGGPVDMTVMYLMHHGFRRDLRKLTAAVPATPVDDHATWRALLARWERFAHILHEHHSGEDAGIWPWLLDRAEAEERETLLAMEAEHERIDPLLEGCHELFVALADRAAVRPTGSRSREELRAGLAVRVAELADLLAAHLRHEETGAMVILQRHMTEQDWAAIEAEHFQGRKSLRFLLYVVPWIAEEVDPVALDPALDAAGKPMRVVLRLGRRGFRRLERRAFAHLPA